MSDQHRATATAGSNIAFVKYWGDRDPALHVPLNDSISMTLDTATSTTTVTFDPALPADRLTLNGAVANATATTRVAAHLDHIRRLAGVSWSADVISHNTFPTGAGIASSASGFAALTVAACAALGLDLSRCDLSRLARLGSGSAARSIDGGFVAWHAGTDDATSYADQLAPAVHWDLVDVIAIVSAAHKGTGSSAGHRLAHTSPYLDARLATVAETLSEVRQAIATRDLARLGEQIEADAIALHAIAMTSRPSILYWSAGTLNVLHAVRDWRAHGGPVGYFTIDAGPNVHVIAERAAAEQLAAQLRQVDGVQDVLVCGVGGGARVRTR